MPGRNRVDGQSVDGSAQARILDLQATGDRKSDGALAAGDRGDDAGTGVPGQISAKLFGFLIINETFLDEQVDERAAVLGEGGARGDEGAAEQREQF
jgi:hypothetical protein